MRTLLSVKPKLTTKSVVMRKSVYCAKREKSNSDWERKRSWLKLFMSKKLAQHDD